MKGQSEIVTLLYLPLNMPLARLGERHRASMSQSLLTLAFETPRMIPMLLVWTAVIAERLNKRKYLEWVVAFRAGEGIRIT